MMAKRVASLEQKIGIDDLSHFDAALTAFARSCTRLP